MIFICADVKRQWQIQYFPRGAATPQGVLTEYYFINCSRKMYEIKNNLVAMGGGLAPGPAPPLNSPLRGRSHYNYILLPDDMIT